MRGEANFGDPDFEPSDEQLQALAHEAFADVAARNRAVLERLHADISAERTRMLAKDAKR